MEILLNVDIYRHTDMLYGTAYTHNHSIFTPPVKQYLSTHTFTQTYTYHTYLIPGTHTHTCLVPVKGLTDTENIIAFKGND